MSVGVQETLRIATPEGVSLELPLAGVGSRFVALLVDTLLQGLAFIAVIVLLVVADADGFAGVRGHGRHRVRAAVRLPVAFELAAGGRTPGKRWSSLRVVCDDGAPVTFRASALRNLRAPRRRRCPGSTWSARSRSSRRRSNQRLGDLAAGTIVVRERRAATVARTSRSCRVPTARPRTCRPGT